MLAEGAAAICPSKFPDSVFASSPERVYPRVLRPFPARRPSLWGSGGKCNAQSARFCASSTRRVRPDGESRFCIAADFFSSACARIRVTQVSSSNDRRSGEVSGFCGNLLCRSRYDVAISIFDRGADIYIFFSFLSEFAAVGRYIERSQVHAIAYAPRDIS